MMAHEGDQVWTCQLRYADADAEDFFIISLHGSHQGAKDAAEADAASNGRTGFEWYQDPATGCQFYSRAVDGDDPDDESDCYMVEEWRVRA